MATSPAPSQSAHAKPARRNHGPALTARQVREQAGLSLRQLEDATGISRATWSLMENGRVLPELHHVLALSEALGVPREQWRVRFVLELEEPS